MNEKRLGLDDGVTRGRRALHAPTARWWHENQAVQVTRSGDAFVFLTIGNPHTVGRSRT